MADPTGSTEDVSPPQEHPTSREADLRDSTAAGTWTRIKEHKILQWGLGYLGAAIAIAHGQELMAEAFDWPHVIGRILMSVLVLGFPLVVTLAWYHGHKRLKRVGPGELGIISLLIVIAAGLLVVFVRVPREQLPTRDAPITQQHSLRPPDKAFAAPEGVSLAVLPFVNMSSDAEQEYFSDGLTEEILNQLAQIKSLRVTGRTSSFSFKGKNEDLRVIGEKLGVGNLLEGSIRKDGKQLRITAQLINSRDGTHEWSQTYNRELSSVFAVQEEIAKDVSQALSIKLDVGEMSRAQGGTTNIDAYEKYLRAQSKIRNLDRSVIESAEYFREAIELDPMFWRAWYGLSDTLYATREWVPDKATEAAKELAEVRAHLIESAPNSWSKQTMLAEYYLEQRKWVESEAARRAALTSMPTSEVTGHVALGLDLLAIGRAQEAVDNLERATKADPLTIGPSAALQVALFVSGRSDEAQAEYLRSFNAPGDHRRVDGLAVARLMSRSDAAPSSIKALARAIPSTGPAERLRQLFVDKLADQQAVHAAIRLAIQNAANQNEESLEIILTFADHVGEQEVAMLALQRISAMRGRHGTGHGDLAFLWQPFKTKLRADPRFKAVLRDWGLADYYRTVGNWGDFCTPVGKDDFECH